MLSPDRYRERGTRRTSTDSRTSNSSHKRSKSGVARSLLQRVASRQDLSALTSEPREPSAMSSPVDGPGSSAGNLSLSPQSARTISQHGSQRGNRSHLFTTMSNAHIAPVESNSSSRLVPSPPPPITQGQSIEQSVRLFKVFEALRSGDTAAIAKASRADDPLGNLEGTTILHLAIQCADLPVIEYVLSTTQNDLNAQDKDGNTPLHVASMLGRAPVVKLLLDQKTANDAATNYQSKTPLDLARNPEIFQQLQLARSIFIDVNVRKIQHLVHLGDYAGLEQLLADSHVRSTLDFNGPELALEVSTVETGGTLLHEAARKRDVKLAQILLLTGADPFRRDRRGKLPQDVTKDERTRAILKKSPAAAAAQRGIQEKAIVGNGPSSGTVAGDGANGGKEGREMNGYLKKWTNYTSGYKLRWFVLEDGVLSYYKNQDDAGSACRGAINMRIAQLHMDPKDKMLFEIHGKSSVKYHLKANHQVEAKRWFWALNNAIQWAKDEAREEQKRMQHESDAKRQARSEQLGKSHSREDNRSLTPGTAVGIPLTSASGGSSLHGGGDQVSTYEASVGDTDMTRMVSRTNMEHMEGDIDDEEEYGDDASSHETHPANREAFSITAQSAKLQLDLVAQVSAALQTEKTKNPDLALSHPTVVQALSSYDTAVVNLKALLMDLLRISRDHEAYWQYRLDREANVRRLWEDSMARVAKEQDELENRIGESEDKRRRTKKALREALEGQNFDGSHPRSRHDTTEQEDLKQAVEKPKITEPGLPTLQLPAYQDSMAVARKRRPTIADLTNNEVSDDESDEDEEFFDAIGAGEVEVVEQMPQSTPHPVQEVTGNQLDRGQDERALDISRSFKGYEDGLRKRLKLDADNRPKVSLWGILKSMIGKDMTKMTLPVSFNEPTSLLYRVVEDMEYTDLLNTAADRADSTERMVYVAAFAASEYASTIGRVAKPFNPLLGETYEYVRPDQGYRFFIEQVTHHPPVGAAFAESAKWDYYGESAVKSKFYGKSFEFNPLGTWFLRIRPTAGGKEELYTWKKVTSSVVGIITGNPIVDNYGPMEVKNWTTGEVCYLDFKAKGWKASSAYQVNGKVVDASGRTRWSIGGRWNDKIYARSTPGYEASVEPPTSTQGEKAGTNQAFLVWEAHARPSGIPFNLTPFAVTLNALPESLKPYLPPTDSRLRPDQRAMEVGEYDYAANEKNRVEEKQRAARRLREARGEEFQPRWFTRRRHPVTGEEYWHFKGDYWEVRNEVAEGKGMWEGLEDIF